MTQLFDYLCRVLAQPMPRRKALKSMIGIIATGTTVLLMPRRVFAATPAPFGPPPFGPANTPGGCTGSCAGVTPIGPFPPLCCTGFFGSITCCPLGGALCGPPASSCFGTPNASGCCNPGQVCCRGTDASFNCCTTGGFDTCCHTGCCAPGTDCCPGPFNINLCCPANAPKCCNNTPGRADLGFCCPANCCCSAAPGVTTPVSCTCPSGPKDPVLHFTGGGAFLSANCKTVCQCDVCTECAGNGTSCAITGGVGAATFTCFNYCTYTLIQSVSLTSFQATLLGGGDFQASGIGTAMVNGVSTNISLNAAQISGVPSISITNANTNQTLAGGTGESGLAGLGLDIFTA
jgi:hypothetical protein